VTSGLRRISFGVRLHFIVWIRKAAEAPPKTVHVAPSAGDGPALRLARVVVLLDRPEGVTLARLGADGVSVGTTLHGDLFEVERQLALEYGSGVEAWEQVPVDAPDPVAFARERLRGTHDPRR